MPYDKNKKLSTLISGKRVALVGPSSHLMGKGLGSIINDFDVVCRINYAVANNFISDYGNRTDVLFYNCCTISLKKMKKHLEGCVEVTKKISLVVCPTIKVLGPEKWREWSLDYISPVVSNFASINIHNLDFYWVGIKNYRYMFDVIDCPEPNSGMLAVLAILEHNPEELFVTGISFYNDSKNAHFSNYPMLPDGWTGVLGHPQGKQIDFFKKYISLKNIKIDSHLNKVLGTNHSNVLKLK